jgi:hypothetical protein
MDPNDVSMSAFLYDAQLIDIDHTQKSLIFSVNETYRIPVSDTAYWRVGSVGRLRLPAPGSSFSFHVYSDPGLRREPALDNADRGIWGWRLEDRQFTIKAGILPGKAGAFVPNDTESVQIDLPRELLNLAAACQLQPVMILREFIANLCGLRNLCACPREDGYSSNGSDERDLAQEYFRRTYGWIFY